MAPRNAVLGLEECDAALKTDCAAALLQPCLALAEQADVRRVAHGRRDGLHAWGGQLGEDQHQAGGGVEQGDPFAGGPLQHADGRPVAGRGREPQAVEDNGHGEAAAQQVGDHAHRLAEIGGTQHRQGAQIHATVRQGLQVHMPGHIHIGHGAMSLRLGQKAGGDGALPGGAVSEDFVAFARGKATLKQLIERRDSARQREGVPAGHSFDGGRPMPGANGGHGLFQNNATGLHDEGSQNKRSYPIVRAVSVAVKRFVQRGET